MLVEISSIEAISTWAHAPGQRRGLGGYLFKPFEKPVATGAA